MILHNLGKIAPAWERVFSCSAKTPYKIDFENLRETVSIFPGLTEDGNKFLQNMLINQLPCNTAEQPL